MSLSPSFAILRFHAGMYLKRQDTLQPRQPLSLKTIALVVDCLSTHAASKLNGARIRHIAILRYHSATNAVNLRKNI